MRSQEPQRVVLPDLVAQPALDDLHSLGSRRAVRTRPGGASDRAGIAGWRISGEVCCPSARLVNR